MAKRPRGGARRRGAQTGGVQAVYEDFRPVSEWKQDDESHILNIYLPGFAKEQIGISTEGWNTIRVRGERLVAGNKWSRFLEDFQVPENGEMNLVRAMFQGGILNITVPIKQVDEPQETPESEGNDAQNSFAKGGTSQPSQETTNVRNQPTNMKDQDDFFPEVVTSQPADERSTQRQDLDHDDNDRRASDQNGDQRVRSVTPFRNTGVAVFRDAEKEKITASEKPDHDLTSNTVDKERKKNDKGTKESPESETSFGREGIPEKKADRKLLYGDITKKKYQKAVEGLAELNEERQLLVNMGAAMLVIVALTAYVTYKFASGKDKY